MSEILNNLSQEQRLPAEIVDGAVLVTAGAGSGKTRMLTHRIAHLVFDLNIQPYNILAITFTNKAANEMKDRLESMLGFADGILAREKSEDDEHPMDSMLFSRQAVNNAFLNKVSAKYEEKKPPAVEQAKIPDKEPATGRKVSDIMERLNVIKKFI